MLEKLKLIRGAVGKKNLSPVLKHLKISGGWVMATNGRLTMTTPIPELSELDVIVPADKFITAVTVCKEPKFRVTETNRLSISGGGFRALVPLLQDVTFPTPEITGDLVDSSNFFEGLELVYEFMGIDASRIWSCGILFHDGYVYATNNVIIARAHIGWSGPSINVPSFLIDELLRIKKKPERIQMSRNTVTLQLEDDVWVNSVLLPMGWPNAKELFDKINFDNLEPVPMGLEEAVRNLVEFCPDKKVPKMYFTPEMIKTEAGTIEAEVNISGLADSIWRAEPLLKLLADSDNLGLSIDFSQHPGPCPWRRNNRSEGLIIGLRE